MSLDGERYGARISMPCTVPQEAAFFVSAQMHFRQLCRFGKFAYLCAVVIKTEWYLIGGCGPFLVTQI